jgi:hypothetical protein
VDDELKAAAERVIQWAETAGGCGNPYRRSIHHLQKDVLDIAGAFLAAGWQPIGTAPKDGTCFLAYAAPGQHGLPELYSLCVWHSNAGFCIDELREPTHWQPLPPPPGDAP